MNRVLRLSRVFLTQSNLQILEEMLQVDNRESWRKIKTKYRHGALMNGAHTSSKHQDYSNRRPVRPPVRPVQPLCDPHNHCATRTSGRHSLDKSERGQPFLLTSLQPTLPTFGAYIRPSLLLQASLSPFLGLGFELLAAGQLVSPRSARFDRIEAPEPLHLAYFRFYHDFLFLSLCFFVLC